MVPVNYRSPMARLVEGPEELRVVMTRLERLGAFHSDLVLPLEQIIAVRATTDAWSDLRGLRAPGTGIPGTLMLGTCRGSFGKDFCVVRGHGPGVVLDLTGGEFARVIVSDGQAPITAERLRRLLRRSPGEPAEPPSS